MYDIDEKHMCDIDEKQRRKTAVVSATRSLQLLLAYLEEAGGRMRAQGLSVHSHCGNQLVSRTMTVRVQPSSGRTTEVQTSPGQSVQAFRLVSGRRPLGVCGTAQGPRSGRFGSGLSPLYHVSLVPDHG